MRFAARSSRPCPHSAVTITFSLDPQIGPACDHFSGQAIAAVPTKLVEEIALIGPPEKIRDELGAWEESVVTTMLVQGPAFALRTIRDVVQGGSLTRAKLGALAFAYATRR